MSVQKYKNGQLIKISGNGKIASIEADYDEATALRSHAVDDIIYFNNHLYKVTTAITAGDTIAVGTNISADTGIQVGTTVYIAYIPQGSTTYKGVFVAKAGGTVTEYATDKDRNNIAYGTCSTPAATAAKTVTVDDFTLETGASVVIKFTNGNEAENPTLNVNNTGAKALYQDGESLGNLEENGTYYFIYNGTQYDLVGGANSFGPQEAIISLSATSVSLDSTTTTATITIITNSDGTPTVSSSDSNIATASISSDTITITGIASGTATITVSIPATTKYTAATATISVTVSFAVTVVPFGTATDAQLSSIVNAYYDGTLSLADIQEVWKIGDTRNVSLSAMTATGVGESHRAQTVQMEILGFDHDTLTTSINGKTKALVTVEQKACLMAEGIDDTNGSTNSEHGYINSTSTNIGGWKDCARRTWCNSVYYNALPSGFKTLVKQVNKISSTGNQQTTTDTTADYCWLPSEWEIFGNKTRAAVQEGTQYAWYANADSNRYKSPHWNSSDVSDIWWERSPYGSSATSFCCVNIDGAAGNDVASNAYGLAPACCL